MNIALTRKYRRKQGVFATLLSHNPVLVLGLDLPFIIVCGTTLKNAVALSIEMLLVHLATVAVAMLTVRYLPMWARMLVNIGAAFLAMTFARVLVTGIFPDISNYVGMYLYLMAVNGITVYQSARITRKDKASRVFLSALLNALAFMLVILTVSLFREYLAGGTLWGIPIAIPVRLSGLAMPFGGFIFMAFFLALVKQLNKLLLAASIRESIRRDAKYTVIHSRPDAIPLDIEVDVPEPPANADAQETAAPPPQAPAAELPSPTPAEEEAKQES